MNMLWNCTTLNKYKIRINCSILCFVFMNKFVMYRWCLIIREESNLGPPSGYWKTSIIKSVAFAALRGLSLQGLFPVPQNASYYRKKHNFHVSLWKPEIAFLTKKIVGRHAWPLWASPNPLWGDQRKTDCILSQIHGYAIYRYRGPTYMIIVSYLESSTNFFNTIYFFQQIYFKKTGIPKCIQINHINNPDLLGCNP